MNNMWSDMDPSAWLLCLVLGSRASSERRPAGANAAERRLQRPQGQVAAAQVGRAAGHPLRHLSHRGLGQRQPDGEDAHPASGGWEGECSLLLTEF